MIGVALLSIKHVLLCLDSPNREAKRPSLNSVNNIAVFNMWPLHWKMMPFITIYVDVCYNMRKHTYYSKDLIHKY